MLPDGAQQFVEQVQNVPNMVKYYHENKPVVH